MDLDECIEQLKQEKLLDEKVLTLIVKSLIPILAEESNVKRISSPVTIVGDIHG